MYLTGSGTKTSAQHGSANSLSLADVAANPKRKVRGKQVPDDFRTVFCIGNKHGSCNSLRCVCPCHAGGLR